MLTIAELLIQLLIQTEILIKTNIEKVFPIYIFFFKKE